MKPAVLSKRGNEKFSYNGYLYVFDKVSKRDTSLQFWRCEEVGRCKGRIHTRAGEVVNEINNHSHPSSAAAIQVATVVTKMKRRAEETMEGTSVVINQCVIDVPEAVLASIPNNAALRKIIRRKRNQINAAPADPADLNDLVLPNPYKVYVPRPGTEETFLLSDDGEGANRILIFGRESWLQHLHNANTWYTDGTFAIAPRLFSQIYIVMATKHGGVHPILYALLPNKQRVTYTRMFELIKTLVPNLSPGSIICDYEYAAFSAMKDCFPEVNVKGCFFHLAQNMKKHLAQIGVISQYNNDAEFALRAKMVTALAFVPIADLDEYIDALANDLPVELQPLLNWFEDSYVGRLNRRGNGRRPPMFHPTMWNLYQRTIDGEDRTNNHAEAANRRLRSELGMHHPTIWKFIDGLRKVQKGRDVYFEQLIAGHLPPMKLKKYRDADERIRRIVLDYGNREPLDYLRGLAHNYQMTQ